MQIIKPSYSNIGFYYANYTDYSNPFITFIPYCLEAQKLIFLTFDMSTLR